MLAASASCVLCTSMPITGHTRLAGVIGWPVSHSRSPCLHGHWLQQHGIDGAYVPLPVRPGQLAAAVTGLQAAGFAGVNVTLPYKEEVLALCSAVEHAGQRAGAVNTLVFGPNGVTGTNTDGHGFIANLRAHGVDPAAGPALLLGAGGAARAIAAALLDAGASVSVSNRTAERAAALAAALPGLQVVPWEQRADALAGCALLVNTTSQGMAGQDALDMPLGRAGPGMAVADIVYAPLVTPLLAGAAARGLRCVGGLGMLLHQAAPGFARWFGTMPVVDAALHDLVAGAVPQPREEWGYGPAGR